ncbi:MAG: MAPEG family protein [Pseudomonadota bacterium]
MTPDPLHYPLLWPLLWPMLAHVGLTAALYALLTLCRAPAVWGVGRRADGTNPWAALESRVSANLSNQFEWPLFYYVACLLAIVQSLASDSVLLSFAWLFVGGRIAHSAVQIFTANVRLRGLVFTVNFLAVVGMFGRLLVR